VGGQKASDLVNIRHPRVDEMQRLIRPKVWTEGGKPEMTGGDKSTWKQLRGRKKRKPGAIHKKKCLQEARKSIRTEEKMLTNDKEKKEPVRYKK